MPLIQAPTATMPRSRADRLGIGRSTVSRSVQRLEDQLNVRLFLRTTRSTTLTHEGDLFYARCHTGLDRIVEAVEEMRDLREGPPRGQLRISSAAGFGRKVVAPLLHEFQGLYPDISIDLLLSDKPTDFISDRADIIAKQIIPMQMPTRMRVFIDFVTSKIRASDLQCLTDFGINR